MRISDWSSDVCSSDLIGAAIGRRDVVADMVEQDQLLARARILQADAAREAAVGVRGDAAGAARREIGVGHSEQRRTGMGVEAGNGIGTRLVLSSYRTRLPRARKRCG